MKTKIILLFIFLGSKCYPQSVEGKVLDTDTKKPVFGVDIYIAYSSETEDTVDVCYWGARAYKIISKTKTDSSGTFHFSSLPLGTYVMTANFLMPALNDFYGTRGIRGDIDSNVLVKSNAIYRREFQLLVTCPFDKTKNQLFCPKCKKKDKVQEIIYGLPIPTRGKEKQNFDNYHRGGCVVDAYCNPTRYCVRCKIEF